MIALFLVTKVGVIKTARAITGLSVANCLIGRYSVGLVTLMTLRSLMRLSNHDWENLEDS